MAAPGSIVVVDGPHIAAGESLSDVVDATSGRIVRITMPSAWTSALLTFQISSDGLFFNEVCDFTGDYISINVRAGSAVIVPEQFGIASQYLKFRSGTLDHPIPQEEIRNFAIAVEVGVVAAP
jgi:hypothetical protein